MGPTSAGSLTAYHFSASPRSRAGRGGKCAPGGGGRGRGRGGYGRGGKLSWVPRGPGGNRNKTETGPALAGSLTAYHFSGPRERVRFSSLTAYHFLASGKLEIPSEKSVLSRLRPGASPCPTGPGPGSYLYLYPPPGREVVHPPQSKPKTWVLLGVGEGLNHPQLSFGR